MPHLYASFADAIQAEKAAGALLDYGVLQEDVSLVAHDEYGKTRASNVGEGRVRVYNNDSAAEPKSDTENSAKHGISTTTGADAGAGAIKGTGVGLGVGVLASIAALAVPGIGTVLGAGLLASALGATALTAGAGAIAGGVTGYLKDQGVPSDAAQHYHNAVEQGGAFLSINVPSGKVDAATAQEVLGKYGAGNVNSY